MTIFIIRYHMNTHLVATTMQHVCHVIRQRQSVLYMNQQHMQKNAITYMSQFNAL